MSHQPSISRRDVLRGRLFRNLLQRGAETAPQNADAVQITTTGSIIMRYPRSSDDVAHGSRANATVQGKGAGHRTTLPILRPPGAVDEQTFLAECTRCDACITACPHDAVIHAPARFRSAAGTPMIDPDRQPCRMCADFPCIEACEPDVLSRLVPKTMGTARIIEQTCLAHQRTTCTVCSEHCPVQGAIEVVDGKPRIIEDTCTGCGVCRYVCPAPENAVLLMPMFARPSRPDRHGDTNDA